MPKMVIWYTFLAVLAYLLLTNYKGANALLRSGTTGYAVIVQTLQGRGNAIKLAAR